jgi:colicin import membrane protein
MKFLAVSVLGWVLVPFLALAQEKVELNTITAVKVNGGAVEITGTKKPNFSTFTMTDPPRLVIDVSEAILKGVPEETRVNNGLITGLRSANYGSETSYIARVLIGYERDVETDIQVTGNTLVVTVLDGAGPRVAQALPTPEQPTPTGTPGTLVAEARPGTQQANPAGQQVASATPQATSAQQDKAALEKAQAEAAAAKKAEEARLKQEEVARAEAAKKAEEDRRKQEEVARAEAAKKAEEERRAQELAAAEEKKRKIEEARAAAEARKQEEADEKKRKLEEARAAAETRKQAEAEEKKRKAEEAEARRVAAAEEKKRKEDEAREEAEARKQDEAEARKRKADEAEARRVAAAEEKKRREEEARAAADARKQSDAEEKRRREADAEATRLAALDKRREQAETRVANVAPPPRREEPVSPTPATVASTAGKRRTLEIVGFQQQAGASRVYIRTNEPVRYKVSEGRKEIILELENTQIGKGNNTRALDTSFFDTAVARVDPAVGPDRSVRVSIKLKTDVPVQTRQEGNTISLEFARPPR